jgi:hypothetical protein
LIKQSSLDENPFENGNGVENGDDDLLKELDSAKSGSDDELPPTPPRPSTPRITPQKTLPWKPKVR